MKSETMLCPHCGKSVFEARATVEQIWRVDGEGEFLEILEPCANVIEEADPKTWKCSLCGAKAIPAENAEYLVNRIIWDTDPEDNHPALPSYVLVPEGAVRADEDIGDYLSDQYEFCIKSFCVVPVSKSD